MSPSLQSGSAYLRTPGELQPRFAGLPWSLRVTPLYLGPYATEAWYVVHDGNLHGRGTWWALICPRNAPLAMSESTDSAPTLLHRTISFPSMEPAFATRDT